MSEKDGSSPQPPDQNLAHDVEEQIKQRQKAFSSELEQLTPWLFEFGNWMFGGLIAFNLVIVAPLLALGAVHPEIVVSIVAFACALPVNVSGLVALKLSKDMNDIGIDDMVKHALEDAQVPNIDVHFPAAVGSESLSKQRANFGLRYSLRVAGVSVILTLIGMVAALWFVAWWVALVFLVVVIVSVFVTMNVIAHLMRPNAPVKRR